MKTKAIVFGFNETYIQTINDLPKGCIHTYLNEFLSFGELLLFYPKSVEKNLRKKELVAAWMKGNLLYIDSYVFQILESLAPEECNPYRKTYKQIIKWLNKNNPIGYDLSKGQPFYEYKLKRFFAFTALGFLRHSVVNPNFYQSHSIMLWTQRQPICLIVYNTGSFIQFLVERTSINFCLTKTNVDVLELKLEFRLGSLKQFPMRTT